MEDPPARPPPQERTHHCPPLPQLLLATALILGNKNGRKFSICSWQQFLSLQAPPPSCPPHRPISYSICSSCPSQAPPNKSATHSQGQSIAFIMISFKAIVFRPYRTNRWVKKKKSKMHLPWPKHFWNCLFHEKCMTDGVSSGEVFRMERSFLLFCQMFPLSVPSIKRWLIFLPLTWVWLFEK